MAKKETLRAFTRRPPTPDEILALMREVAAGPDRAVGVILATLTEDALEKLLLAKFREHLTAEEKRELFENDAPLASFSAKIRVAYAMGAINMIERDDLVRIKDVRNAFAHAKRPITFNTPLVAAKCAALATGSTPKGNAPRADGPKSRFALAARLLAWCLNSQPRRGSRRQCPRDSSSTGGEVHHEACKPALALCVDCACGVHHRRPGTTEARYRKGVRCPCR